MLTILHFMERLSRRRLKLADRDRVGRLYNGIVIKVKPNLVLNSTGLKTIAIEFKK
jgi:hypothetical protein